MPLAVLGLLAAFTFWMERLGQDNGNAGRSKLRHDADFWVDDFTLRRYDADGTIKHLLNAKRLEHYPDDETTQVIEPRLVQFGDRPTTATARTAWLDKEGKHIRLDDDVRLVRQGEAGGAHTVVTTSVLHVMPDDEYAFSRSPVTITQGQTLIRGTGLDVNNKTRLTVLSGPVQGIIYRKDK